MLSLLAYWDDRHQLSSLESSWGFSSWRPMLRHILRAIDLKLRLEFLTKSQLKVLVTVINKSGAQSAHFIEESEKRTKQVISKSLPPSFPTAPSVYLVLHFQLLFLVGELRTYNPKFTNEGRKYWYGNGEGQNIQNYKKVCVDQKMKVEHRD